MAIQYDTLSALVVEDNGFVRRMIAQMLRDAKLKEILEAPDGQEALKIMREGKIPDLLICDIQMKPMDGLELVKTMRSDPKLGPANTPVIILTSNPEKENVLKAKDVGVGAFLAKPVSRQTLFGRIDYVLGRRSAAQGGA